MYLNKNLYNIIDYEDTALHNYFKEVFYFKLRPLKAPVLIANCRGISLKAFTSCCTHSVKNIFFKLNVILNEMQ